EATLGETLASVVVRAGFEGAAPEHGRTGFLDRLGDGQDLLFALHRARAGDDRQRIGAHPHGPDGHDRQLGMKLTPGQLVGLEDVDDFFHSLHRLDLLHPLGLLVADGSDHRALHTPGQVDRKAQLPQAFHDSLDVVFAGSFAHYHDHCGNSSFPAPWPLGTGWLSTAAKAAKNRSFCSCVPMVTRRWVGRPKAAPARTMTP